MSRSKQLDARRPVIIAVLFATLLAVALTTSGCGKQMARMESNQVKLQAMIMANARQLATVSSQVHTGQNEVNRTLAQIDHKADGINSEVLTVQNSQAQLRETIVAGNEQINRKIAKLETNQAHLKDGVAQVGNIAQSTNVAVGAVAKDQATLHRMVQANKQELADGITAVAKDQQRTHAGIDQLQAADRSLAGQITGVAQQQDTMQKLAQDNNRQLVENLTSLGTQQTALHDSLRNNTQTLTAKLAILEQYELDIQSVIDRVANTTDRTADNITTLASTQSEMRQTQATHYENLTDRLTSVAQKQQHLQTGIGTLDKKADRATSQLTTLAAGQNTIAKTMHANNTSVNDGLAQLSNNQQTLHGDVRQLGRQSEALATNLDTALANQTTLRTTLVENSEAVAAFSENQTALQRQVGNLHGKADTMASALSAVATEIDALHNSVRHGNDAVAAQTTTLAKGQQNLKAGIGQLAEQTEQMAARQTTLHQAIQNHDDATRGQMADMASDQETIRQRVDTVMATASQIALNLVTMSNRQSEFAQEVHTGIGDLTNNQETLQSNVDTLATSTTQIGLDLIAVSEDQNQLQQAVESGVSHLANNDAQLASGLRTVGDRQTALNETLAAHDENVAGRMASLAETQTQIHSGLDAVSTTTTQIALDVITLDDNQARLEQTAHADRAKFDARLTEAMNNQRQMQTGLDTLGATTIQVALDVLTLDDKQAKLSQNTQANHEALVAKLATAAKNQQQMQTGLDTLDATTTQVALDVLTLDDKQARQSQSTQANHEALVANLAATAQNQQQMQGSLDIVTATTGQIGLDIIALDGKQAKLSQNTQANHEALVAKLATAAKNQQQMQTGLDTLGATTTQVALDVLTLDDKQARQSQNTQANHEALVAKLATAAKNQQQMQTGLDTLGATTTQVALDVLTLDDKQAKLSQSTQANHEALVANLAATAENQQQMQTGLDTLTATTTQVALDVLTLDNKQASLSQSTQANHEALVAKLMAAAQGQEQMQGSLDIVTATAGQIGLDIIALDGKQDSVAQAMQTSRQEFGPKLTSLAENQQQLASGLDTLTATTTQVALDVLTLDDSQSKQAQALKATRQTLTSQIEAVTQGQQQMQSNLDTVTATTSQVALDVITLDDNQDSIKQAVQANRQELATKLTEIAQGQQQWLARFDAAEAKVAAMTDGITALEQRVTKLQGTLQTSLQDLSTLLDTESQQRVQFQDSVRQDMQSVTDSIAQLREIQSGLAEHIQRVQNSTQSQTGDILSALEQLQQKTDAETTDVDTELKSSMATPQEVMLP